MRLGLSMADDAQRRDLAEKSAIVGSAVVGVGVVREKRRLGRKA
jgi:hypothetical protein